MKKIFISILLFIIHYLLFIVYCQAQPLDDLYAIAIEENLKLKILEKEYLAALEKAPQVSELPDPELGIGIFPLPVETRLGPQILRVGATQMFPWKGLLVGRKEVALAKAKALYEKVNATALEITYQLEQAYFQLYEIEKSQTIIRQNQSLLASLEKFALTKVESGSSTAADVLRVQLKTEELNQELLILETMKNTPLATINQLLNRALDTPITLTDTLAFATLPYDKNTLIANIAENHPTLRMFELQQAVSQQLIALNELGNKPTFGVGLDYFIVNERADANPAKNGRDIVQVRGMVKIPLFKKKYDAKEREEQIKIETLAYKRINVLNQFTTIIEKAYADYETARLKVELYRKQMEITRAAIRILETNYSAKGNNFDELLQLEKELIDYDLKILKAIVESHLSKSSIERFF